MTKKFSSDLAFSLASFPSYQKGEEYFEEGAVRKIWRDGDAYKAIVDGTSRYNILILFKDGDIKVKCSCPYDFGGICKHAVAAILAFAKDPKLANIDTKKQENEREKQAKDLIGKAANVQIKNFLVKLLANNETALRDFKIFLQGNKETNATIFSYKQDLRRELDNLDLDDLEEAWYQSGEDYYGEYYGGDNPYSEDTISSIMEPFKEKAEKYRENENYAESLKILQAAVEALLEKEKSLESKYAETSDWFLDEVYEILNCIANILRETQDLSIKKVGVEFLCGVFEYDTDIGKGNILDKLKNVIENKNLAQIALSALSKTKGKQEADETDSSLLSYLYFLAGEYEKFEEISVKNVRKNPSLTLNLLRYYKKNNRKDDILNITYDVLDKIKKRDEWGHENIEIEIRRFLDGILDDPKEYEAMIANGEALFLKSKELGDYKNIIKKYKNKSEKEKFLSKIKEHFDKDGEVEAMFKVFKLEEKKREILELVFKYTDENVFPRMVSFISNTYPKECFQCYKEKIKKMLKEANVRVYPYAARHLKEMEKIGMDKEFEDFIVWLRTTYSRRIRFIEELKKSKLI